MKILTIALILVLTGCSPKEFYEREDVEAVYWHEGARYSAAFRTDDGIVIKNIPVGPTYRWPHNASVSIITDAVSGSWYECGWTQKTGAGVKKAWCKIHIGSIDELNTGDWNHGKFGNGTTTRID